MSTILVLSDHHGFKTTLDAFPVVFGRDETSDVLLTSVLVSRQHCEIVQTDEGLVLRDLGSVNGTMINGVPIKEHVLKAGDQLKIGTDVFDVDAVGNTSSFRSGRKGVFGGVAQMLKLLGRECVQSSRALKVPVVAGDAARALR